MSQVWLLVTNYTEKGERSQAPGSVEAPQRIQFHTEHAIWRKKRNIKIPKYKTQYNTKTPNPPVQTRFLLRFFRPARDSVRKEVCDFF
jgi:hypothetical protein